MNDRQRNEEAIFHIAREIADPEKRAAYLEQVCAGDLALRHRVEDLLKTHEQDESFLKSKEPVATTAATAKRGDIESNQIGPYKIREQIGEGGMGIVYVAEQQAPVKRKVALKVIKPGMDSKEVVARFEAERQALAMMDHPGIAKVFDGGVTETGQPYFAMELINGIPITQYCDEQKLGIKERLELFIAVCHAVQHAHQKGVIHRDIKPTNVLVTLHDGKPVPVVIDFGVAKATNQNLTDQTIYTRLQQVVGTTLYMSPEQAELSRFGVDTRSDIYSLGVLLYEMLAGTTPFDRERFKQAALDEVRRIIREEEPPKPSTRLSTLGENATRVSSLRRTDPQKLRHSLRGDLDWIVMMALEKDRNRRYETANGLAMDVTRYLDDEPILARPPSTWYRMQKFYSRNKALTTTSLLIVLSLAAGLALAVWGINEADWERRKAVQAKNSADLEREKAIQATNSAELERGKAELERGKAIQATETAEKLAVERRKDAHISQMSYTPALLGRNDIRGLDEILNEWRPKNENEPDLRRWEWHYLKNLVETELGVERLFQTPREVTKTRVSDDGNRIIFTNPVEPMVRILDRSKPSERQIIWEGANIVNVHHWKIPIEITADGRFAILPGDLRGICILNLDRPDAKPIQLLQELRLIRSLELSRDGRFLLVATHTRVAVIDMNQHSELWSETIEEIRPDEYICALAAGFENSELYLGTNDGRILCLRFKPDYSSNDFEIDEQLSMVAKHTDEINRLAVSGDGRYLVTASKDSRASAINLLTGTLVKTITEANQQVRAIGFSRDNKTLWLGALGGDVRAYSIPDFEFVEIVSHRFRGYDLEVDNANQIYFGGGDDNLFQLKRDHFRSSLVFQSGDRTTVDIVLSENGRRLATLDGNAQLVLWNLGDTRAIRANPRFQLKGIVQKIFKSPQPDSEFFYALVADTTILKLCQINWPGNAISETILNDISIDPASGDQNLLRGASGKRLCVDIDSQARFVFIGDPNSNTIWQYDLKEDQLIETLERKDSSPQSLSWIEPEQKLAIHQSSNRGQELIKIDLDSEASETIFVGGDTTKTFLIRQAPENSGFFLIEQLRNSRIQLRDPQGKLVREFDGETSQCGEFKWLDKGKTLVSPILVDGAIRFWDVESGRERFNIDERPHILNQLDVSDDGTTIAAGTWRTGKIFVYRYKPPIHE